MGLPNPSVGEIIDPLKSPPTACFDAEAFVAAMRQTHQRQLYTPAMLREGGGGEPTEDVKYLRIAYQWIEDFITQPKPEYGLTRAVCPFVKPSIDLQLFFMAVLPLRRPDDLGEIYTEMNRHREIYEALGPVPESWQVFRTIVTVLPYTPKGTLDALVSPKAFPALKTEWLERGVMIGQFYSSCPFTATFNRKLHPHQSPIPFYAIRPFIETDWRFIRKNKRWQSIYRAQFGEPSFALKHRTLHRWWMQWRKQSS